MKLIWLGQAGYVLVTRGGTRVMIDPYLSDALFEKKGEGFRRRVPPDESWLTRPIDALVLTHDHDDHTDPATLSRLLAREAPITVLAPMANWDGLRRAYGGGHNYLMFDAGIEVTVGDALLCALPAAHSDPNGIGVLVDDGEKCVYHTGDTMFRRDLARALPRRPDALLLPINGVGNNMNARDAKRFADLVSPGTVYPMHWDMFAAAGCDPADFTRLCEDAPYAVALPPCFQEVAL